MSAASAKKSVGRKYNKEWEKEHSWLMLKDDVCFCKLCLCTISQFKKHNLVMHEKSDKHRNKEKNLKSCQSLAKFVKPKTVSKSLKEFDIKFSVAIACHCSIRSVDHLGDIVKEYCKGGTLEHLKLHRTKCACLIKNVISLSLFEELVRELRDVKYYLFIDESTDISSVKHLCLCVRFYSQKFNSLKTEFLGMIEVVSTTGENLFAAIENFFSTNNIDLSNCIGFSSDGASNVCGKHNSVLSRLKEKNENLVFIKCTCHSLALCCEYANKKLPSNLDFLIAEIARWFKCSSIRQTEFKEVFTLLNDGCIDSTKFITPANTRWLVKGKCIYAIVTKWEELKLYFKLLKDKERNYHANIIDAMLNDQANLLYLTFLLPIIQDFEHLNAAFQATHADVCKLNRDVEMLHHSLKQKIDSIFLGAKFELLLRESTMPAKEKDIIKEKCLNAVIEASRQLEFRLLEDDNVVKSLHLFKPERALSQMRPDFKDLPKSFHAFISNYDVSKIENQYVNLLHINWKEEIETGSIPSDPIEFWAMVIKFENALGEKYFTDIGQVMLNLFSAPISNAFVERIFSFVTNVKSKQRNKLATKTIDSVLRIKSYLLANKTCCKDFHVTERMLSLFTSDMYLTPEAQDINEVDQPGCSKQISEEKFSQEFEDIAMEPI